MNKTLIISILLGLIILTGCTQISTKNEEPAKTTTNNPIEISDELHKEYFEKKFISSASELTQREKDAIFGRTFFYEVSPKEVYLDQEDHKFILTAKRLDPFPRDQKIRVQKHALFQEDDLAVSIIEHSNPRKSREAEFFLKSNSWFDWANFLGTPETPLMDTDSKDRPYDSGTYSTEISFSNSDEVSVPIQVTVPLNTTPGDYYGAVSFSVPGKQRISILTVIKVGNQYDNELDFDINDISADTWGFHGDVDFNNIGNALINSISGKITINGKKCSKNFSIKLEEAMTNKHKHELMILPNSSSKVKIGSMYDLTENDICDFTLDINYNNKNISKTKKLLVDRWIGT